MMDVFASNPEVAAYSASPKAMPVGAVGKRGRLKMEFEIDNQGKSILRHLERQVPLIVQQALYFDEAWPDMPCVYILSSGGPNVDGDRYRQEIVMHKDSYAFISTGAATKLASMRYNYSAMVQRIVLDEGAYLEFLPEPVIPCRHTRFVSDTQIVLAPFASLFYAEIYTSGRRFYGVGESFAYDVLSVCTHAEQVDGRPLFREKMVIRPDRQAPSELGVMDKYHVFANVVVLTPEEHADALYDKVETRWGGTVSVGVTRLPSSCGLLIKVLGTDVGAVKQIVREFCSLVRWQIKGRTLPTEFPWR